MNGPLWSFADSKDGTFVSDRADTVSGLYFPLFNLAGMKSFVTPQFKGDICSDFHHYLTIPVVREDLHRSNASRNFWVAVDGQEPWSATGVSAAALARAWDDPEPHRVEAGIGWFRVERTNRALGLLARVTAFVPSGSDHVELMQVEIENIGSAPVKFRPYYALPIFGRTADNLRDHRQVTTMCQEIDQHPHGVVVKPRIHHDENGHQANATRYAVLGFESGGRAPAAVWRFLRDFTGEGGTLENPSAVFLNSDPVERRTCRGGEEAVGAFRFAESRLAVGGIARYVVLHGISEDSADPARWCRRYGSTERAALALAATRSGWDAFSAGLGFSTSDPATDRLMRWVAFQPVCRMVYGNSYLPDYGYGRGGRGWRDLWQDLLGLFLVFPERARGEILNNFRGVRLDGSNATIVGTRPGEFVADRNRIVRTWCDHGAWPMFVMEFYLDQTGDYGILLRELPYFKDGHAARGRMRDDAWNPEQGNLQRTAADAPYRGTLLEHLLIQSLAAFFHVGRHNNLLLEGADWNDTIDMARTHGESVTFQHFYAWNLERLAAQIDRLQAAGKGSVKLLREMLPLLDRLPGQERVDYEEPEAKRFRLDLYFRSVSHTVSGDRVDVGLEELAADLREKAASMVARLRSREWIRTRDGEQFFNGHYDDHARRVDGDHPLGVRMDLPAQAFPVLFGTATDEQVAAIHRSCRRYLRNRTLGGLRLCTDFRELKLDYGRITGYVYGYKEHGSIWNQMNVILMHGLYARGFVREGYAIFREMCAMCLDSAQARCFPNLPSYFEPSGRGAYNYLTGSATWLMLALVTQVFGIRGEGGAVRLHPKLVAEQFDAAGRAEASCRMHGRMLNVCYRNASRLEWNRYRITALSINGESFPMPDEESGPGVLISRRVFLRRCSQPVNTLDVCLG